MAERNTDSSVVYLHGDLHLAIIEARNPWLRDVIGDKIKGFFAPWRERQPVEYKGIYGPMARVAACLDGKHYAGTDYRTDSVWNKQFDGIPLAHPVSQVEFRVSALVKFNNNYREILHGIAVVSAERISSGELIDEWVPVLNQRRYIWPMSIHVQVKFTRWDTNPIYSRGVVDGHGLKESYFPLRHGGKVTLYQDAHIMDSMLPGIMLSEHRNFEVGKCWEDICHAIYEAKHLVYLIGWSVYHKVRLIREPTRPLPNGRDFTLGELLKYKSEQGVRVLLLLWKDKAGSMKTHDIETQRFFNGCAVKCVLASRNSSLKVSGITYTHHQKCVIVDKQDSKCLDNNRKITAFLGGLDITDSRYDTPDHRLFGDLDTVFKDDFHNPALSQGEKGPRQPWHDLHCKIEGPAAYDVLENFEQRWRKATRTWFGTNDRDLIKINNISSVLSPQAAVPGGDPSLWVSMENSPENWHVQVFRSIDSDATEEFQWDAYKAMEKNLVFSENVVMDSSILAAYIRAIRCAQHTIYIENQYFIGSSYAWSTNKDSGADNPIPIELALKIASKIRARERFAVYVVIPMWPEGSNGMIVPQILHWQWQTMQMMYTIIAKELKSAQLENVHPFDYLNFYCLGKREENQEANVHDQPSSSRTAVSASQQYGRCMIYVHSKGMIVDDEYVIVGSANINQRSMNGSRDTEIAIGAYQPHHTWANKRKHPRGQVYGYRMSLWAEHLGLVDEYFRDPKSLNCVRKVNSIAEDNWKRYIAEEFSPLQGHILKYPIQVEADGTVNHLLGQEHFPDGGGKILGIMSPVPMPRSFTT